MTLTLRPRMAKMGRPRKEDGESGTTQVRCFNDLAEMISELALVLPKTTAQIIDGVARAEITLLHDKYKAQIEKVKAAEKAREETIKKAREEAEQLSKEDKPNPSRKPRPGT